MRRLLSLAAAVVVLLAASVPARADGEADAKALIEKALKARGGADLDKKKAGTMQIKGKFYGMGDGIDYIGDFAWQTPDQSRVQIDGEAGGQKFTFTQIINKDKGWFGINGDYSEMDKEQLAEAKESVHAGNVTRLSPEVFKTAKLELLGEDKVNDKPALGVRVEVKGYRAVTLYFDKETHLLVKSENRAKDIQNLGPEFGNEVYYSDYKKVDGVQIPHKVLINHDGKKFVEGETTDYKILEKIEDTQFTKPK